MPSTTTAEEKRLLRARVRRTLSALTPQARAESDRLLRRRFLERPETAAARTVLLYYGMGTEVDTAPLLLSLLSAGKRVALPRCTARPGEMEARLIAPDTCLYRHRFGMLEPGEACPLLAPEEIDLVLVPGLAFDRAGYRLARYPERYFPGCTALIAINDMQAIGALDGLLYSGRNVLEEISVVGFDNLLFAGVSRISLTSVDHHPDVLAQAAMDLLRHRITPESRGHWLSAARFQVDCAPRLVMRNSTARLNVK